MSTQPTRLLAPWSTRGGSTVTGQRRDFYHRDSGMEPFDNRSSGRTSGYEYYACTRTLPTNFRPRLRALLPLNAWKNRLYWGGFFFNATYLFATRYFHYKFSTKKYLKVSSLENVVSKTVNTLSSKPRPRSQCARFLRLLFDPTDFKLSIHFQYMHRMSDA